MNTELNEILQHHGVKGMKWGKRKLSGVRDNVKSHVKSIKRENSWNKTLKNTNKMSTKEIQKAANRSQLENDFKRFSKTKNVGTAKDKKDYLRRENMSDQELNRKVQRLRAKDSLNRNASEATKKQKEIAKKVVQVAAPIVVQYALTRKVNTKDIINSVVNSSGANAKAVKSVVDKVSKAKHSDLLDDVLLHSILYNEPEDDILQHFGVKGMKWGKRKVKEIKARGAARKERIKTEADITRRRRKGEITRKQAKAERWKAFHKEQSVDKHYKKAYDTLKSKGIADKKAMTAAYRMAHSKRKATTENIAKAVMAGKVGVKVGKNVASLPSVQMKGKNLVQAMKRSPVKYVDGKKMKNVINFK